MKRRCDFSVDNVAIGQNKQRKLEENPAETSFQMAARKCQEMARWSFSWIPKLFSNESEEKDRLHSKAQRSPDKQTNKRLEDSSGDESQSESQSESKSDDNLDLRCLLSKEVKSVKTGRQFKALIRINQSEFRCMICEITICNKSELKSHFIHPRHERYDQYYKEVDTDSSWSQNDPRNWKARKRSRKYSNKHVLTHEKQPHRNGFKSALEIRHAFEEKMSDLGLPSSFGESRYVKRKRMFWKKKPKRKPKSLPENYHNYETYPKIFSKDCQYGTEHQYNEESILEHQESRGDQGCDRDSREDQYCDRDLIEDQYYDRDSIEDQYCDRDPKEDQYYDRDSIEDQN